MSPFSVMGAIVALAPAAPHLAEAALKVFERTKSLRKPQKPQGYAAEVDNHDLDAAVANVQEQLNAVQESLLAVDERVDALEGVVESQAELIVHLTRHNVSLGRWVLLLATALAISSGIAIAALVLTIL